MTTPSSATLPDIAWDAAGESWSGRTVVVLSPTPTAPLDAGNRQRVFHLCRAIRDRGARIVFVHYPSEADWRAQVPPEALAAMSAQWDEQFTVPVTVPLHPAARDLDHLADEWWDPAIGMMLDWVFRTHVVDVLLVNYTWLSRAFEHCPAGVLRVLDTHDRFSGRREMLASAGIAPEFFHTVDTEECRALSRAHVVWSIKPQEAAFFRSLGIGRVINMPFWQPGERPSGGPPPSAILRFGLVGAANRINLANTKAFLAAIHAYVARTLLPCEIVIAGGICDMLEVPAVPWIRLMGRLPELAAFYEAVDVVVAPISVSTGLKIKVGEALCQGKAVVALEHAFEGYPPHHQFHRLASLEAMMAAMRRIVNEPRLIAELEQASALCVRDLELEIASGLALTIAERARIDASLCIILPVEEVFEGSLVLDHVLETAQYLAHLVPVLVFLDGTPASPWLQARFELLGGLRKVVVATHPEEAETLRRMRQLGVTGPGIGTREALLASNHIAFWFVSALGAWEAPPTPLASRAYCNLDVARLGHSEAEAAGMLARLGAAFAEVVTLSRRGLDGAASGPNLSASHRLPAMWRGERSRALNGLWERRSDEVAVLADSADDPLLALTLAILARLSSRPVAVVVAEGAAGPTDGVAMLAVRQAFMPGGIAPGMVIDIASDPRMECAREIIDRSHLPYVRLFTDAPPLPSDPPVLASSAAGLFASVALLAELLTAPALAPALVAARAKAGSYREDAGWTIVWKQMEVLARQP